MSPMAHEKETGLSHVDRLEAESIYILREAAAQFDRPVMLYSIGKDSSVLLHLALKAFFPAKPPFPILHVDTGWKFRDMIGQPAQHKAAPTPGATADRGKTPRNR